VSESGLERQDSLVALHVLRRFPHDLQETPGALGILGLDLERAEVGVDPE
jgi:hypothetical protein